ncbi:UNVERIFIED_CONTAM: hypothetical protein GTU68_056927 [Idotea baltica]|nr:hypothetical protein [Idotea baltica]
MRGLKTLFIVIFLLFISCKQGSYSDLKDGLYADIQTEKGNVIVNLEYKATPITVANFVTLTEGTNPYVAEKFKNKLFYNDLIFHRVVKDYIIQGGDPQATGEGGPGYQFEDEFPMDSIGDLLLTHNKKGVLSMANGGFDTNGSQFFITLKATPNLDGVHSVFGNVVNGLQVVDVIKPNDVIKKIEIIRVGNDANKFNAPKVFENYFKRLENEAEINNNKAKQAKISFLEFASENKIKADSLASGLKIYFTKKNEEVKSKKGAVVNVYYSGYFTSGELITTNVKEIAELYQKFDARVENSGGYNPKEMDNSPDAELIPGFKEGLLKMNIGDKVMLFIPSHLGYGTSGRGPIPPDTDLIFELEIVE